MGRLLLEIGTKAGTVEPVVKTVHVIARRFSLTKQEYVSDAKCQWHSRYKKRKKKTHFQRAEANKQNHHESERAADQEPEQITFQPPRPAFGIVGAVGFRESKAVFHWNVPTSTVDLPMPKAVNSAFTMTGAPAMMSPPTMDIFPVSASPRRMAKPPPMTQSVPKRKPMSMTMPNADEAPDERLLVDCARMGLNPASVV